MPAFIPTAAYASIQEGADMRKKIGLRRKPPKSEARPLGTPRPKPAKKKIALVQKVVDTPTAVEVDCHQQSEPQAIPQAADSVSQEQKVMTLTLKTLSRNGKRAIYTGAVQSINFTLGLFPGKTAPTSIEIPDGVFVPAKAPKVKMTAEERKAANALKPKATLAEKAAAAQKRADALKAKVDAANQM